MKMVKLTHLLLGIPVALALECRPEGQIVPPPRNLKQSDTFQKALANLTATLDSAFKGEIRSSLDAQNVSLSIALVGLDQTDASTPLWEYHHLGSGNVNGTKSLDRHSQYLVGSVSKVITDAVLLRSGVNMDDPVTKYLPSLANNTSRIDWKSISLRALGGQLAGIPANCTFHILLHLMAQVYRLTYFADGFSVCRIASCRPDPSSSRPYPAYPHKHH